MFVTVAPYTMTVNGNGVWLNVSIAKIIKVGARNHGVHDFVQSCMISNSNKVYLVDFGKSDIIPENHIKPLPDSVIQFPMLAYRLQLRSIPIGALVTSEQRRKVTEILTSQPIELFNIEYESTIFQVMIQDSEIEKQLDQLIMSEHESSNPAGDQSLNDSAFGSQDRSRSFPVSHELEAEQKYKVKIETIIDTNHAYITLVDRKEDFSAFQKRFNQYCDKQKHISQGSKLKDMKFLSH